MSLQVVFEYGFPGLVFTSGVGLMLTGLGISKFGLFISDIGGSGNKDIFETTGAISFCISFGSSLFITTPGVLVFGIGAVLSGTSSSYLIYKLCQ